MIRILGRRHLLLKFSGVCVLSVTCLSFFCGTTVPMRKHFVVIQNIWKRRIGFLKFKKENSSVCQSKSTTRETVAHSEGLSSTNDKNNSFINNTDGFNLTYKYYLTAIIMVRIYKTDLAKWSVRELKQWMHYLFIAGVEHIYLCDHYVSQDEQLRGNLARYIDKGLLTYIDWPWNASLNGGQIMVHQVLCYTHVIQTFGADSKWQTTIDMDEYPLCPHDFHVHFLSNYLRQKERDIVFSSVSQVLMENFLMLGKGNGSRTMVIERINRITKKIANKLTKPIFKPRDVADANIHSHYLRTGKSTTANVSDLLMLHFWGARLQNWGPDTEETMKITKRFTDVANYLAPLVRKSLISFGENDAFSNMTGP